MRRSVVSQLAIATLVLAALPSLAGRSAHAQAADTTASQPAPAAPSSAPAPSTSDPGDELRHAVAAAEEAFAGAFAARDRERFFAYVHPDAVFLGPGAPLRGKEAVVKAWSAFFEGSPIAPFSWRPVMAEAHGDLGLTQGPVLDASGKWVANFSSVWQRQPDGRWLVVFDGAPPCRPLGEPPPAASPGAN